jgi:hypothetical protein
MYRSIIGLDSKTFIDHFTQQSEGEISTTVILNGGQSTSRGRRSLVLVKVAAKENEKQLPIEAINPIEHASEAAEAEMIHDISRQGNQVASQSSQNKRRARTSASRVAKKRVSRVKDILSQS